MKMNKRLLSGLLALVMIQGMIPLNAIATDETTAACEDCGAVGGHIVGCEHYIAPSCEFCHVELIGENVQHTTGCPTTCTCNPKPAEGEAHVSPCPLYTPVSGASLNLDGSESSESTGDTTGSTTSSTDGSSETTTAPTTQATTAPTTEATTTPTTQATTAPTTEATTAPTTQATTAPTTEATTAPTTEAMTEATEPQKTFAETLLEIDNLSDLLIEVCKEENLDAVLALTAEEITALRARAQALYDAIENPTEQDGWDRDDLLATTEMLPNYRAENACPDCGMVGEHTEDCPWVQMKTFPTGTALTENGGTLTTGEYYLPNNIDLKNTDNIIIAENANVTIDLNGMVLRGSTKAKADTPVIKVGKGATLTIKDSQPTIGHNGNITAEGLWVWAAGNFSSQSKGGFITSAGRGQGIALSEATLIMTGGTIAGCKSSHGSAIVGDSNSQITISNSRIIYNITEGPGLDSSAAAIHNEPDYGARASFVRISNSEISHNKGNANGGGIIGYDVTLTNCVITDNEAYRGAGVYVKTAGNSHGKATITGCTISNNKATYDGGGVFCDTNATVTVTGNSVISDNEALHSGDAIYSAGSTTINGYSTVDRGTDSVHSLIHVAQGANLNIEGNDSENPIIIDGKNVIANNSLIYSEGAVQINNAVIKNGKNRASKSLGGGLFITATGSLVMNNSTVTRNTAKQLGGGIYCAGTMEINNSVISYNVAATGTDELVNMGRGGGFELSGAAASCTLNNTIIEHNQALYYGGGGQADNGAKVVMNAGTIFRHNKAVLHGAGAFHLTADAEFVMNGGSMEDNFAQYCGGAIHSSYSCVLELNAGTIKNNTAKGRGAGIHINTGGAITLNENITISGNKVYKDRIGTYAVVDETGDNITGMKYEGADADFGYGGGVLIDSGTCTVAGATIKDNYALVGGGGVALTMLNMGESGLDDLMVIKFTMTAGSVSNNTTDGDGAGVYIMTNKAKENIGKVFNGSTGGDKELSYEEALKRIDETNRHGFTGQQIVDGIPEAVVSGGTIVDNVAQNNGGGLYLGEKTRFEINGTGDISSNEAVNGAGAYIASGTAVINGGTMTQNTASNNGGAIYVLGDVTMTDGSVTKNQAKNGGALYIDSEGEVSGEFLMSGGAINENTATVNGGAAYVAGGNVTIEHGSINSNKALTTGTADELQDATNNTGRGGAIYMAGDETTVFKMESGTMNNNTAANDGGAIFATGGTLYIGLEGCKDEVFGATCSHHTAKGDGRHHPQVMNNSAADTGGGIAIAKLANDEDAAAGKVYFYCGKADSNSALYKGVGKNVFMNGGEFFLYKAADVGEPRDPDLVIVGGTLHNMFTSNNYVKLKYYYQNSDTETQMEGSAEYAEFMNLPDGEYFWDAPEGMRFLGWTAQGAASGNLSNANVRNKEQYLSSGDPVQILDHEPESTDDEAGENTLRAWDGKDDGIMNLYALWVPEINDITYIDDLTDQEITNNPATYTFSVTSNIIDIQPVAKPGYDLVGWYIYQDENQNANWNNTLEDFTYERYNVDGTERDLHYMPLTNRNSVLKLEAGLTNFGDITMIAKYVPAFTTLVIDKNFPANADYSIDVGQSFVFTITGRPSDTTTYPDPINMTVVVQGDSSVTVEHIPVGKYIVKELNDWSWRYKTTTYDLSEKKTGDPVSKRSGEGFVVENIEASDAETTYIVTFTNTRTENKWLDGDSFCRNWFNGRSFVGSKSD